ncbi:zinc finger MYM-type protein 1-like [Mauremys reevesii]|uniref:zinc finger MYM-type protein 1-like n=1 Tax=Mauremys reevesii TaxID=260615 RepID=UPI00193FF53C|nr:zinc finger MYM-type protein 1-like [Mauremys reevesii]
MIDLMSRKVLDNILRQLGKAKYKPIIMDCTPDISHSEMMSLTVRFVDYKDGCIQGKEHFICFWSVDSPGKGLTALFMKILNENKIKLQGCHSQGYDNGANMKGRNSGAQAKILALIPRAFFIPCGCHFLNLVVSHVVSSSVFGVLQRIYVLFSASTIRWKILTDNVTNLTIKLLSDTNWDSRIGSVMPVRYRVTEVYSALLELAQLSKVQAESSMRRKAWQTRSLTSDFWSQLQFGTISCSK